MITKEELEKVLESYETKNISNEKAREIDSSVKKFTTEKFETLKLDITQANSKQHSDLMDKVQSMLKQFEQSFKGSVLQEVNNVVVIMKKSMTEQVLAETHEVIKKFMMENSSQVGSTLQGYNSRVSENVNAQMSQLHVEIDSKLSRFNESVKYQVEQEIKSGVHSQADNFSQMLTSKVVEQYEKVSSLIENFKKDISFDLDKKIVDKQSIEAKFSKIEEELKSQIGKTIDHHTEQTRNMMEQYAKAEISQLSEEIRSKTTSIFDSME